MRGRTQQLQTNVRAADLPTSSSHCLLNDCNAIYMLRNMVYMNYHIKQSQQSRLGGC